MKLYSPVLQVGRGSYNVPLGNAHEWQQAQDRAAGPRLLTRANATAVAEPKRSRSPGREEEAQNWRIWLHRTGVKHLDPGPPRRSLPASGSPVLSRQASDG